LVCIKPWPKPAIRANVANFANNVVVDYERSVALWKRALVSRQGEQPFDGSL
jgi:hypothetical protein